MQFRPGAGVGAEHQLTDRLAAVSQGHHKQPRASIPAALGVPHHGARAVIDLSLLARCGHDHGVGFGYLGSPEPADEALDALIATGEAGLGDQVLPDGNGVAASGESEFDPLAIGFAGAGRGTRRGMPRVGTHFRGRFCCQSGGRVEGGLLQRQIGGRPRGRFSRAQVGGHLFGRF